MALPEVDGAAKVRTGRSFVPRRGRRLDPAL